MFPKPYLRLLKNNFVYSSEIQIWLCLLPLIWQPYQGLSFLICKWNIKLDQWFSNSFKDKGLLSKEIDKNRAGWGGQPELSSHLLLNPGLPWVPLPNQGSIISAVFWSLCLHQPRPLRPSQLKVLGTSDHWGLFALPPTKILLTGGKELIFRYSRLSPTSKPIRRG